MKCELRWREGLTLGHNISGGIVVGRSASETASNTLLNLAPVLGRHASLCSSPVTFRPSNISGFTGL